MWWVCFGILALEGVGQILVVAVVWPPIGDAPSFGTYIGLVSVPLAILAMVKARQARQAPQEGA